VSPLTFFTKLLDIVGSVVLLLPKPDYLPINHHLRTSASTAFSKTCPCAEVCEISFSNPGVETPGYDIGRAYGTFFLTSTPFTFPTSIFQYCNSPTRQPDNSDADNVTIGQQIGRQPPTSRFQRPCNNPTTAQRTTRQKLLYLPTSNFPLPTSLQQLDNSSADNRTTRQRLQQTTRQKRSGQRDNP